MKKYLISTNGAELLQMILIRRQEKRNPNLWESLLSLKESL